MKLLLAAIVLVLTYSFCQSQELPPKHQLIRTSVSIARNGFYALATGAGRLKQNYKHEVTNPKDEIVLFRDVKKNGKMTQVRTFFRRREEGNIMPLTLKNLKGEFPNEVEFHKKLDILAKNDFQLVKFRYCINRIYSSRVSPFNSQACSF